MEIKNALSQAYWIAALNKEARWDNPLHINT
jgi:hypothetical protein